MKIEVSVGEVVDKVTILEIKLERVRNEEKLKHIRLEYDLLKQAMQSVGMTAESEVFRELKAVNLRLWEIEDKIRLKEKSKKFDDEFIELARSVYLQNDRRSEIKKRISMEMGSRIIEEKEYVEYDRPGPV